MICGISTRCRENVSYQVKKQAASGTGTTEDFLTQNERHFWGIRKIRGDFGQYWLSLYCYTIHERLVQQFNTPSNDV